MRLLDASRGGGGQRRAEQVGAAGLPGRLPGEEEKAGPLRGVPASGASHRLSACQSRRRINDRLHAARGEQKRPRLAAPNGRSVRDVTPRPGFPPPR